VQWYNGYDGKGITVKGDAKQLIEVAQRVTEVEKMYTSVDDREIRALLEKYEIQYVVFGNQEKIWSQDTKKELNRDIYKDICIIDWQKDDATVFKCR
jgi:uncharacterized membrane protein